MPVTKTFYYFDELSKEAQEKALEECRYKGTDNNYWYKKIISKWETELLPSFGFENADVSWRLHYAQGDGASFTANVDTLTFLKHYKLVKDYRALYNFFKNNAENCYITVKIVRKDHMYTHEFTVGAEVDGHLYNDVPDKVSEQADDLAKAVIEVAREEMKKIYDELDKENWRLAEDKNVKAWILSNQILFDEDGNVEED